MSDVERDRQQRARHLMMARLDGELSLTERTELDQLLAEDEQIRSEWARLRRVKEVTETMSYRKPPEEIWDTYWTSVYNRLERGAGWILVSLGAVILLGYATWHAVGALLSDSGTPPMVKVALFALVLGGLIVFVSVLREKLLLRRKDPFREVQR